MQPTESARAIRVEAIRERATDERNTSTASATSRLESILHPQTAAP
jgi:hypothetical protein